MLKLLLSISLVLQHYKLSGRLTVIDLSTRRKIEQAGADCRTGTRSTTLVTDSLSFPCFFRGVTSEYQKRRDQCRLELKKAYLARSDRGRHECVVVFSSETPSETLAWRMREIEREIELIFFVFHFSLNKWVHFVRMNEMYPPKNNWIFRQLKKTTRTKN